MPAWELRSSLYVHFDRSPDGRRPVRAQRRAPTGPGERFLVPADKRTLAGSEVYVVFRPGQRTVVLGAGSSRDAAEALRARLGEMASSYEVAAVPIDTD
jgi:hypothetical protein